MTNNQPAISEGANATRFLYLALPCAFFLLALYSFTMPSQVAMEDNGLFILSAYFAAPAHPPGYPLWTAIAHCFSYLPFGSIATRINLASAVFAISAALIFGRLVLSLTKSMLLSGFAILTLAFTPLFWSQAIVAEVYSLHALFYFAVLYCCYELMRRPPEEKVNWLPWPFVLFAFSLSNHWPLTLLSMSPFLLVALWDIYECYFSEKTSSATSDPTHHFSNKILFRKSIWVLLGTILGLSPYLWLIWRSQLGLPYAFTGAIENSGDFIAYFNRELYQSNHDQSATSSLLDKWQFILFYGQNLLQQFHYVFIPFIGIGLWQQFSLLNNRLAWSLIASQLASSFLLIFLLDFDFQPLRQVSLSIFFLTAYLGLTVWLCLGIIWTVQRLNRHVLALIVPACFLLLGFPLINKSEFDWASNYSHTILNTLPQNAVLFVDTDFEAGPISYAYFIDRVRPDVTLKNSNGLLYGNRTYSNRLSKEEKNKLTEVFISESKAPVFATHDIYAASGANYLGMLQQVNHQLPPGQKAPKLEETILKFWHYAIMEENSRDPWVELHKQVVIGKAMPVLVFYFTRTQGQFNQQMKTLINQGSTNPLGAIALLEEFIRYGDIPGLEKFEHYQALAASQLTAVNKTSRGKFHLLVGQHLLQKGEKESAMVSFQQAIAAWPDPINPARQFLKTK